MYLKIVKYNFVFNIFEMFEVGSLDIIVFEMERKDLIKEKNC